MIEKQINKLSKIMKRKKEVSIFEIIIKNYNNANFFMSVVHNKKINKFKVLFIPLDMISDNDIENYMCYQFIDPKMVEYIITNIKKSNNRLSEKSRNNLNTNIDNFYIEINTNINNKIISYKTTQYIPKKWTLLFDPIVIVFEYCPNIVSDLCEEILSVITNHTDPIKYKASITFDLYKDELKNIFNSKDILDGEKYYNDKKVKFLEKINGKYYSLVSNHLVIIEYNSRQKILNLYSDFRQNYLCKHIYAALISIKNNEFNEFYKLMEVEEKEEFKKDNPKAKYYLCYGLDKTDFRIIKTNKRSKLPISLYKDGLVKIIGDNKKELEKVIE